MVYPSRFGIVAQGQDDQAYHHLFYGVVEKAIAAVICACPKKYLPLPYLVALRASLRFVLSWDITVIHWIGAVIRSD